MFRENLSLFLSSSVVVISSSSRLENESIEVRESMNEFGFTDFNT